MTTETFDKAEFMKDLGHFTGSETFYKYLGGVVLTEGAKYVADKCGAFWLMDKIALNKVKEPFQVWKLTVQRPGGTAKLVCEDGNGNVVKTEELTFTDFPLDEFTLWRVDNTILLPSEY